jgi:hypothetical protein
MAALGVTPGGECVASQRPQQCRQRSFGASLGRVIMTQGGRSQSLPGTTIKNSKRPLPSK